jgi:hypothetical protein
MLYLPLTCFTFCNRCHSWRGVGSIPLYECSSSALPRCHLGCQLLRLARQGVLGRDCTCCWQVLSLLALLAVPTLRVQKYDLHVKECWAGIARAVDRLLVSKYYKLLCFTITKRSCNYTCKAQGITRPENVQHERVFLLRCPSEWRSPRGLYYSFYVLFIVQKYIFWRSRRCYRLSRASSSRLEVHFKDTGTQHLQIF